MGLLLAGVAVLALAPQAPPPGGPDATELVRLEEVWNQAHREGDADALDRLWADDIVVIVPKMPPFRKTDALAVLRSGRMKFGTYATSDVAVRRYEGCAVVTGRLRRSRTMGERTLEDDWRFTKVYVPGPKGWQVAAFHASDAGQ